MSIIVNTRLNTSLTTYQENLHTTLTATPEHSSAVDHKAGWFQQVGMAYTVCYTSVGNDGCAKLIDKMFSR